MVRIDPARLRRVLVATIVLLAALDVVFAVTFVVWDHQADLGVVSRLYLDHEQSLGTLAAIVLLTLAGGLALVAAAAEPSRRRGWLLVAALLLLVGADEVLALHERASAELQIRLDLHGALFFAWVLPGLALAAVVVVVLRPFVASFPAATRRAFVVGGALYLAGAAGVEMLGGMESDAGREGPFVRYQALVLVEEVLELSGVATLGVGMAQHLGQAGVQLKVEFAAAQPATAATTSATDDTSDGARS